MGWHSRSAVRMCDAVGSEVEPWAGPESGPTIRGGGGRGVVGGRTRGSCVHFDLRVVILLVLVDYCRESVIGHFL